MLELKNISLTFNLGTKLAHQVYKDFNFSVNPGEFVIIIGSNGTGKSTLFNVISGDIIPDKGRIYIDGKDCTRLENYKRSKLISCVTQDPKSSVIPSMTIKENLVFALKRGMWRTLLPYSNKSTDHFLRQVLSEFQINLGLKLNEFAGNLSGGGRQVLSLLMATLAPSKLLLLDEHLAALDPKMSPIVMSLTEKIIKLRGLTTLMITHNMTDALKYGDRTILLHKGKILKDLSYREKKNYTPADLACLFNEV